jgi:hypothetical protein
VGVVGGIIETAVASDTRQSATALLDTVLSRQFVKCLATNIGHPDGLLNSCARNCLAAINKLTNCGPVDHHRLQVIKSVLNAERSFDQITRTKFVAGEIGKLGDDATSRYMDFLGRVFNGNGEMAEKLDAADDVDAAHDDTKEKHQLWAVEQLYALAKIQTAKSVTTQECRAQQLSILCLFLTHGFFDVTAWAETQSEAMALLSEQCKCPDFCVPTTSAVRDRCRQRAYSLLQEFGPGKLTDTLGNRAMQETTSVPVLWSVTAIDYVSTLLRCDSVRLEKMLSEESLDTANTAEAAMLATKKRISAVTKRRKKDTHVGDASSKEIRRLWAFQYLLSNLCLQQLNDQVCLKIS